MKQIGTFTQAGLLWIVYDDTEELKDKKDAYFSIDYDNREIRVCTRWDRVFSPNELESFVWGTIISIIFNNLKLYKFSVSTYTKPISSCVLQAKNSLYLSSTYCGGVSIMGTNYNIEVDERINHRDSHIGEHDFSNKTIKLSLVNRIDTNVMLTLWHEIIHAINAHMHFTGTKLDKERVVHPVAMFVYEAVRTLSLTQHDTIQEST